MAYYYKYPINYAPNESGDTTAFAVKQLIRERNYIYQILNNIVAGNTAFVKAGVVVATTRNISLYGEQTIDGVSVEEGDRVLVWKQGNSVENGVYVVSKERWKRADDADDDGDFANGYFTGVARGTYAGQLFAQEGYVSVNSSPLNFRNVIQGDMVSREVYKARDEANQAKATARGYADNARESREQAETAKAAAEEAANKAGAAQTETEKAKENVLLKEKSVENYYNEVVKTGKEVTDNQNKATDIFRNVLAKQGALEDKQQEIQREQNETSRLLEETRQGTRDIAKSVIDSKTYSEESKSAAMSSEESAKNSEKSKTEASQSVKQIRGIADSVNEIYENIGVQLEEAESINKDTKEIEKRTIQSKTELNNLRQQTETARNDTVSAWNDSKKVLDRTLEDITKAKKDAEKAKTEAETAKVAAEVSEGKAKSAADTSVTEAEKARVEAANAKTEAENAKADAERALTNSNKSEELRTEAKSEASKAREAADEAKEALKTATGGINLDEYAKKESLVGLATTDYVDGRIKHVVGTAPEALDTLGEIATALTENKDKIGTIVYQISTKADRGTVENALMGKAQKADVYTKRESDKKYALKSDMPDNVYTKEETDSAIRTAIEAIKNGNEVSY